jgi:hypothetical protein
LLYSSVRVRSTWPGIAGVQGVLGFRHKLVSLVPGILLVGVVPLANADQLLVEGRQWLRRITALQGQRITLRQHREILVLADGWPCSWDASSTTPATGRLRKPPARPPRR